MRELGLLAILVLLGACSSHSVKSCGPPVIPSTVLSELENPMELEDALTRLLVGHCRCDFAPLVAEEITFDGKGAEAGFDPTKAECLGRSKIVSAEASLPGFGSVTVEQERATGRRERFVIVFVHNGSRWLLYWPAPERQRM